MTTTTGRAHGTRAKYVVEKCRCTECRTAVREYERWRTRQRAYGRTAYVDAEPVRAHLHALSAQGLGWKRAADLAGVTTSTVWKLLYGDRRRGMTPSKRVRRRTAAALLAVRADLEQLGDAALVPGIGVQRRLQALVAIGWSQSQLARRLGVEPGNLGKTLRAEQVFARTARAVRELYEELWDSPPAELDKSSRQSAARARNHAQANGWVPPLAWDDDTMDDPTAAPDLGDTGSRGVDLDEVDHLAAAGAHISEIARRLGRSVRAIEQARFRARSAS